MKKYWFLDREPDMNPATVCVLGCKSDGEYLCITSADSEDNSDEGMEANAHLLLAAPNLLDVLEDMMDFIQMPYRASRDEQAEYYKLKGRAYEAISKARGATVCYSKNL